LGEKDMEDKKDTSGTSGKDTLERGKAAIEADRQLNEKGKKPADAKKDEEKDAAKWHEEG
jgi:hypothetical protein